MDSNIQQANTFLNMDSHHTIHWSHTHQSVLYVNNCKLILPRAAIYSVSCEFCAHMCRLSLWGHCDTCNLLSPTSGLLKCWATCVQISLTAGHYPPLPPQWIYEFLSCSKWTDRLPRSTRWGQDTLNCIIRHFLPLSDDVHLALCSLCHCHACQWSKHCIVILFYCVAIHSFNENFVLALPLSMLE